MDQLKNFLSSPSLFFKQVLCFLLAWHVPQIPRGFFIFERPSTKLFLAKNKEISNLKAHNFYAKAHCYFDLSCGGSPPLPPKKP